MIIIANAVNVDNVNFISIKRIGIFIIIILILQFLFSL